MSKLFTSTVLFTIFLLTTSFDSLGETREEIIANSDARQRQITSNFDQQVQANEARFRNCTGFFFPLEDRIARCSRERDDALRNFIEERNRATNELNEARRMQIEALDRK